MTRWTATVTPAAVDALATVVRRLRPEIDDTAPALIGEGISTLAYEFSSPSGAWVLRVSRDHPAPWTWRGGRRHEVELLAELRRRGLPVPAEATVVEEADGLPTAILERRVVGTRLSPELVRAEPGLTTQIAAMLDRLHAIEVDHAVTLGVPRDDPTAEFRSALDTVELTDDVRRRVEVTLAVLESRTAIRTVCHRDFRVEHLLVDDDGELAGLLDLGEVGVDDPGIDLAHLHGELGGSVVTEICAAMTTADTGLAASARAFHSLWPLLELAPGGEWWGDPATARGRLEALV